ncbi:hypothetical protein AcV7_001251 [Taiwanofungus camphoratus]|nr:hypothetical protein AcV7_001251 [Antrodia cinnamomea]
MAKPRSKSHSPASPIATGSTVQATRRSRQSTRRRAARFSASPSYSILVFFATLAASSHTADGHPLPPHTPPPEFLCPGIGLAPTPTSPPDRSARDLDDDEEPLDEDALTTQMQGYPRSLSLADKYIKGTDSRWRKTDIWTLYGSTVCVGTACTAYPTATSTEVITEYPYTVTSAPVLPTSYITPTAESDADDQPSSLPSGWTKSNGHSNISTAIIIALSIVLAVIIVSTIVMCVLWRRKRTRRLKDPEKRARKKNVSLDDAPSDVVEEFKRFRSQQRLWEKALARWKANAKQSPRRRRKRAMAGPRDVESRLLAEPSSNHHADSSASLHSATGCSFREGAVVVSTSTRRNNDADRPENTSPSPSRPPAYLPHPSVPVPQTHNGLLVSEHLVTADIFPAVGNVLASSPTMRQPSSSSGISLPYAGPISTAHVATDDKAVLARMQALASAPPSEPGSSEIPIHSLDMYATVPPLDDEFEELPFHLRIFDADGEAAESRSRSSLTLSLHPRVPTYSRDPSPNPSVLPPPPSKARLTGPTFFEYPMSFEEDTSDFERDMGPSAPPFQEEEYSSSPSAPPLEFEYDQEDLIPSAPGFDEGTEGSGTGYGGDPTEASPPPRRSTDNVVRSHPAPSLRRRSTSVLSTRTWHGSPPRYLP